MNSLQVMIIGAGPAGVTAAIQLQRSGISPVILEKQSIGGLVKNAGLIENYPGFPEGISGDALTQILAMQLQNAGVTPLYEEVLQLDYNGHGFLVQTGQRQWTAEIVILASGTRPRNLADLIIPAPAGRYIFYEIAPVRDITGRSIAIVGAGDAAFDYALSLGQNNDVVILNRSPKPRCLPSLQNRVDRCPRIAVWECATIQAIASVSAQGLQLAVVHHGRMQSLHVNNLVIAVGREPRRDFLTEATTKQILELERKGLLYQIGDVANGAFRQIAIAVGDGMRAAMTVAQRVKETNQ